MGLLLSEDGSVQGDVVWCDSMDPQGLWEPFPIKKSEHIIGTFVSKAFPAVGVDMAHHEGDFLLGAVIECPALGDDVTDKLMVAFGGTFLVGRGRVAVKKMRPLVALPVAFDGSRVGELGAIVSQEDRHEPHEHVRPQLQEEPLEDVDDGLGVIGIPQKGDHEFSPYKVQGKEDPAALVSLDGVELYNRQVGMDGEKVLIVPVAPSGAAPGVHFQRSASPAPCVTDPPWKVDVPGREHAIANKTVESALADHDAVPVAGADVVEGLPLPDEGGYDQVEVLHLCPGKCEALPGFRKGLPVFLPCGGSMVEAFLQGAGLMVGAAVAHIWGTVQPATGLPVEVGADEVAFLAAPAVAVGCAGGTETPMVTSPAAQAAVESTALCAGLPIDAVVSYFL